MTLSPSFMESSPLGIIISLFLTIAAINTPFFIFISFKATFKHFVVLLAANSTASACSPTILYKFSIKLPFYSSILLHM